MAVISEQQKFKFNLFTCKFNLTVERNADVLLSDCKDIGLAVNIGKTKYMEIGRHRGVIANAHIKKVVIPMKKWKRLNTQALY